MPTRPRRSPNKKRVARGGIKRTTPNKDSAKRLKDAQAELRRARDEAREALEQQKASGEVLAVISGSIADTKPVFDKILQSCQRLFEGNLVGVTLATADNRVALAAYQGEHREQIAAIYPMPLSRESGTGWAILEGKVAHFPDVTEASAPSQVAKGARVLGFGSIILVPLGIVIFLFIWSGLAHLCLMILSLIHI